MNGRLIVFEGTDGSEKPPSPGCCVSICGGKTSPYKNITFPRYGSFFLRRHGAVEYSDGNFRQAPRRCERLRSVADVFMDAMPPTSSDWGVSEAGGLIADRYTTSNAVHQASKLPEEERSAFF